MVRPVLLIFMLSIVLILSSCKENTVHTGIISDNLYQDTIGFELAIYFLEKPQISTLKLLQTALESDSQHVLSYTADTVNIKLPSVSIRHINDIMSEYAPPDTVMLEYFGYGMSQEQKSKIQQPEEILVLDFLCTKEIVWLTYRKALETLYRIAHGNNAVIWDEEARVCYTSDEWKIKRIDSWKDSIPDLGYQFVIHFYREDKYCRAITLGMAKFGLPDLVLNDISCHQNKSTESLINLICQTFAERGHLKDGALKLNVDSIQCTSFRGSLLESLIPNAKKKATVPLKIAKPENGDPDNRLIEIAYPEEVQVYQEKLISDLFGSKDSLIYTKHDGELLAASQRAKEKMSKLQKIFQAGLLPNESILVKAPFETVSGGNEWMWVEVVGWNGNRIEGILQNDPYEVPSLKAGARVLVKQDDLFDYIHTLPDGTREGNETGEIIERNAGQ